MSADSKRTRRDGRSLFSPGRGGPSAPTWMVVAAVASGAVLTLAVASAPACAAAAPPTTATAKAPPGTPAVKPVAAPATPAAAVPAAKATVAPAGASAAASAVRPSVAGSTAAPSAGAAAQPAKPSGATGPSKAPAAAPAASAPAVKPPEAVNDGPAYKVSKFELLYGKDHKDHPPLAQFMTVPITLGKTDKGYVAPRAGVASETIQLGGITTEKVFFASAIRRIDERIVAEFNRLGLVGIFVAPHEKDISTETGKDERAAGNTKLRLVVWSAVVARVRTVASGDRVPADQRLDSPLHARIREHSPLQPKQLLNKPKLEEYAFFLSRHPGRKVDVAVTSADRPQEVSLDYLVSENKPWLVYAQTGNTGTEATSKWRHRFGFIHNQLTGNDDILTAEYTTCGFDEPETQSASASYEAPFFGLDRLRWRVYGSYARYEASVPTGTALEEEYWGSEWQLGGEFIANVFQKGKTFLDAIAGATWRHLHVKDLTTGIDGEGEMFLPHVGLKLERLTETASTVGTVTLEWACMSGTDEEDLERLGRTHPDRDWVLLNWDVLHSFYLEPLLCRENWLASVGSKQRPSTLAHEMAFMFRGQYAMSGYRLIPQMQRSAGGFFTVRGYPESSIAGDTAMIATAEYRLHVPRLLWVSPEQKRAGGEGASDAATTQLPLVGTPFRWAPQAVFGRPDWDLIVRVFYDVGRTMDSWRLPFEENQTIMGAGVGVELQFTRYINVRCDWGMALRDLDTTTQTVQAGDHRFHFVATVLY